MSSDLWHINRHDETHKERRMCLLLIFPPCSTWISHYGHPYHPHMARGQICVHKIDQVLVVGQYISYKEKRNYRTVVFSLFLFPPSQNLIRNCHKKWRRRGGYSYHSSPPSATCYLSSSTLSFSRYKKILYLFYCHQKQRSSMSPQWREKNNRTKRDIH